MCVVSARNISSQLRRCLSLRAAERERERVHFNPKNAWHNCILWCFGLLRTNDATPNYLPPSTTTKTGLLENSIERENNLLGRGSCCSERTSSTPKVFAWNQTVPYIRTESTRFPAPPQLRRLLLLVVWIPMIIYGIPLRP